MTGSPESVSEMLSGVTSPQDLDEYFRTAVGALNEKDEDEVILRIDPALCSERTTVLIASFSVTGKFAKGIAHYLPREAILTAAHPRGMSNAGRLRFGHGMNRKRRQIPTAFIDAVIQHHAIGM